MTVFLGGISHRAEVIDLPADHPQFPDSFCVRFTPPVVDRHDTLSRSFYTVLTAAVGGTQVEEGWPGD